MAKPIVPENGTRVQIPSSRLFAASGVYFLYLGEEVVYVGQAADMRKRIGQHLSEGTKDFDGVSCVYCRPKERLSLEQYFITALIPRYNNCLVVKEARRFAEVRFDNRFQRVKKEYVSPGIAASMMGLTHKELDALGDKGPKKILRRVPRSNVKRTLYEVASIRAYLEAA